jgi:hypothetical protein
MLRAAEGRSLRIAAMFKDAVWVLIIVVAGVGCFQFAIQLWDLFPH